MNKQKDNSASVAEANIYVPHSLLSFLLEEWGGVCLKKGFKKNLLLPAQTEIAHSYNIPYTAVNRYYKKLLERKLVDAIGEGRGRRFYLKSVAKLFDSFIKDYWEQNPLIYICCAVGSGLKGDPDKIVAYTKNRLKRYNLEQKCTWAFHSASYEMTSRSAYNRHGAEIYARDLNAAGKIISKLGLTVINPKIEKLIFSTSERDLRKSEFTRHGDALVGYDLLIALPYRANSLFSSMVRVESMTYSADPLFTIADLERFPLRGVEQAEELMERVMAGDLYLKNGQWWGLNMMALKNADK